MIKRCLSFLYKWLKFTLKNMSLRSGFGLFQEAIASQKNTKSFTTPAGFRVIKWQMPRNAESFSSLSRIERRDEHLKTNYFSNNQFFKQSIFSSWKTKIPNKKKIFLFLDSVSPRFQLQNELSNVKNGQVVLKLLNFFVKFLICNKKIKNLKK